MNKLYKKAQCYFYEKCLLHKKKISLILSLLFTFNHLFSQTISTGLYLDFGGTNGCVASITGYDCFYEKTNFCVYPTVINFTPNSSTDYYVVQLSNPSKNFTNNVVELGRAAVTMPLTIPINPIHVSLNGKIITSSTYRIRVVLERSGSILNTVAYNDNGWDLKLYRFNFPEHNNSSSIDYYYSCETPFILDAYSGSGTFYYDNPINIITAINPSSISAGTYTLYYMPICSTPMNLGQFDIKSTLPLPPYIANSSLQDIFCGGSTSLFGFGDINEKFAGTTGQLRWYDNSGNYLSTGSVYNTPILTTTTRYACTYVLNGCESNKTFIDVNVKNVSLVNIYDEIYSCENEVPLPALNASAPGDWYIDGNHISLNSFNPNSLGLVAGPHTISFKINNNSNCLLSQNFNLLTKALKPTITSTSNSGCNVNIELGNPNLRTTGFTYRWYDKNMNILANTSNTLSIDISTLTPTDKYRVSIIYNEFNTIGQFCESDFLEFSPVNYFPLVFNLPYDEFYACESAYNPYTLNWASISGGKFYFDQVDPTRELTDFNPTYLAQQFGFGTFDLIYVICGQTFRHTITIDWPTAPTIAIQSQTSGVSSACNTIYTYEIFSLNSRGKDMPPPLGVPTIKWYTLDQNLSRTLRQSSPLSGTTPFIAPEVQGNGSYIECEVVYNNGCIASSGLVSMTTVNDARFDVISSSTGTLILNKKDALYPPTTKPNWQCSEDRYATFTATAQGVGQVLDWKWEVLSGGTYSTYYTNNASHTSTPPTYDLYNPNGDDNSVEFRVTATSRYPNNTIKCVFVSMVELSNYNVNQVEGFHLRSHLTGASTPLPNKIVYCNLSSSADIKLSTLLYLKGNSLISHSGSVGVWEQKVNGSFVEAYHNPPSINKYAQQYSVTIYGTYRAKVLVPILGTNMICEVYSDEVEIVDPASTANYYITSTSGASPQNLSNGLTLKASFDNATILYNAVTGYKWYLDDILINTGSTSIVASKAGVYKLVSYCCGVEKTTSFTVNPPNSCFTNKFPLTTFPSSGITTTPQDMGTYNSGTGGTEFQVNGTYSIGSSVNHIELNMNRCTKIVVKNGGVLTLNYCSITSCTDWRGIEVENGGKLVMNYCLLSDAQVGIYCANGGEIQLSNSSFINNHNHITITGAPLINNSTFTSNFFGPLLNRIPDCSTYSNFTAMQGKQILLNNGANNIWLKGNTFNGNSTNTFNVTGVAIVNTDNTKLTLNGTTPNTFKGDLKYGVSINNNFSTYSNFIGNISLTTTSRTSGSAPENAFIENVETGVYVVNSPGTKILANKFIPNGSRAFDGVVLIQSDDCMIEWNKFLNMNRGVQIYNNAFNQLVTHVKLNEFQNNEYGLVISPKEFPSSTCTTNTSLNIQNVQFHCNKFFGTPSILGAPKIDPNRIGILGSGSIPVQGSVSPDIDVYNDFALDNIYDRNIDYDIAWDYTLGLPYPYYYYQEFVPAVGPNIPLNGLSAAPININGNVYVGVFNMNFSDISNPLNPPPLDCQPWALWKTKNAVTISQTIDKISISPNPTFAIVNIKIPEEILLSEIKILDVTGRVVYCLKNPVKNSNFEIDLSQFSSGVYNVHLITNAGDLVYKLIKR